ncbi:MAG: hypothetical protein ACK502_02825 [Alphaproteobacteria bacterium]
MKFWDKFKDKKRSNQFTLDATSRKAEELVFIVRDIEIAVKKLSANEGIAEVHFRGGTEDERSSLSTLLLTKIPDEFGYAMRSGSPVSGDPEVRRTARYDEDYILFSSPDDVPLVDFRNPAPTKPPVTFEVLSHAAESIERKYKSRILGEG